MHSISLAQEVARVTLAGFIVGRYSQSCLICLNQPTVPGA